MFSAGIDIGSTSSEIVVINEEKSVIHNEKILTSGVLKETGQKLLDNSLKRTKLKLDNINSIIATGYGRKCLDFATGEKTEIFCYAAGAFFLDPGIRTIIDVGGQDSKVISVAETGKIKHFSMNDKCAAGTGKFLEMISSRFNIKLDQMGPLSLKSKKNLKISSICAVFAESEAISMISYGEKIEDVLNGAHLALCERITGMAERVGINDKVMFCGGVAKNSGMVKKLEDTLGKALIIPKMTEFVGALGAALVGLNHKGK